MSNRRQLIENIGFLFLLQGANFLLPLITLPYLVRVLGPEGFGLIAFAQVFILYFVVLTSYGFDLTAAREIAVHREDTRKVSEVFCAVMFIKCSLMLVSFLIMAAIVFTVPRFREDWPVYFVTFIFVIGQVLFPIWFFQGMEKMKYITGLNIVSRSIAAAAVFAFVKDSSDLLLAAVFQNGGMTLTGVLGLCAVRWVAPVRFVIPSLRNIQATLRDGWYVFVSQVSELLRSNSGIFVLGLFYGNLIVGYFSIADKTIKAANQLIYSGVGQGIYPRSSVLFAQGHDVAVAFLRKVLLLGGLFFVAVSTGLFLGADTLVWLVAGEANSSVSTLIRVMAIAPLIVFVDNVYGTQVLLPLGRNKQFMSIVLCSGLFSIISALLLVPILGALGSAIAFVASQVLLMALMIISAHSAGVELHKRT